MTSLAQAITSAAQLYTILVYFIILTTGIIGNFTNILVFSCLKIFRRNQCAFYLIIGSIADFVLLLIVLPFRISSINFGYDPTRLSVVWCKIRQMMIGIFALTSMFSVCFVAIDQYLSTNCRVYLRQISTLKLAHRLVSVTIILLVFYHIPFLIYFDIEPEFGCVVINEGFSNFLSFGSFGIFGVLVPTIIPALFAILAYKNVRHVVRRQLTIVRRKLDRQMTAMILAKVAFFVVTTQPFVICRIYLLNIPDNDSDLVRIAIEQLIFTITSSLFYINSAGSFYLYLMVSKRFRQQVKHMMVKNVYKKLFYTANNNRILPTDIGTDLSQD